MAVWLSAVHSARAEFRFAHHYIDRDLPGLEYGQTSLVDGDHGGDLDICRKLWRPRKDNANGGKNHADFVENLRLSRPKTSP